MIILMQNHKEEYAVREMVNSFFPKLKIKFVDTIPSCTDEDYIISSYDTDKSSYDCIARIDGRVAESNLIYRGFNKTQIKKSIMLCLNKLTGIALPWGLLTGIRPSKIVREYIADGGNSTDAHGYLENFYMTSPSKASLASEVEKTESVIISDMYPNGISLYVGIPFCPTRCLYCSFTSQSVAFSNKLTEPYINALKKEISAISETDYIKDKIIETVYVGGGTPTALSAEQIKDVLDALYSSFDLSQVKEITFEAGRPDTITEDKLKVIKEYGISRISINPQTIHDSTLKLIGRNHTYAQFEESYELARKLGFSHINCDIIAGLPDETTEKFIDTVEHLKDKSPESITVHTMCIKHGSYLDMKYDMYTPATANTVNSMLEYADIKLRTAGMQPYYMYRQKNMLGNLENVGYCLPGHECIYNIYIMEEVQSIVALGAGGSTKLVQNGNIERVFNVKEVSEYINRIDEMIERKTGLFETFGKSYI